MHNPIIAILAAGVAGWLFGAVWYTVLGRVWQAALGGDPGATTKEACKNQKKMPLTPMLVSFLAALVMSAVLYQLLINLGVMGVQNGAVAGLTVGIGFVATSVLVNNMFQGKKLMVTIIDSAHWVLALVIEGVVISLLD
ncbi:MAG TPA: DUF1761 domain-containing protein [Rhizomicrobium sp.]|nr:DUF1761 domain-containing protein [Rhizomicrobium sp.]